MGKTNGQEQHFSIAKIGHDGMVQDEQTPFKDIRVSETCALGKATVSQLPACEAREDLYSILNNLKSDLQLPLLSHGSFTQNVPKLDDDLEEIIKVFKEYLKKDSEHYLDFHYKSSPFDFATKEGHLEFLEIIFTEKSLFYLH